MKYLWIFLIIILISFSLFSKNKENIINNNDNKINSKEPLSRDLIEKISIQNKDDQIKKDKKDILITNEKLETNSTSVNNSLIVIEKNNNTVINDSLWINKIDEIIIKEIKNLSIVKLSYSSNIDNTIKFKWVNLDQIKIIEIWDLQFTPHIIDSDLYIPIIKNNILKWNYFIYFYTKSWEKLVYKENIHFNYEPWNIFIGNITPSKIKNDISRNIVLQWKWFSKIISIQLSNNIVFEETSFNIINDNVMSVIIPKWIDQWEYSLNLMNIDWIYKSKILINIYNQ